MNENPKQGALITQDAGSLPPVANMLQAIIDKGVTTENVAVIEKMMDLFERQQTRDAEKQFAAAFVGLQSSMPAIEAVTPVPDKQGNVKYMFAPYEEIMRQVKPVLQEHGFTVSFSCDFREGRIIQTCTLRHIGGHKESTSFAARVGAGPYGASEAQADGAASTYAKRFALCNALNIVVERDSDARSLGSPITFEQVQYLKEQVKETKSNEAAFLKYAGAAKYEDIMSDRYDSLVRSLLQKARQ